MSLPGLDRLTGRQRLAFDGVRGAVHYDCEGTMDLLRSSGISCPPFETYADHLVNWVSETARKAAQGTPADWATQAAAAVSMSVTAPP